VWLDDVTLQFKVDWRQKFKNSVNNMDELMMKLLSRKLNL